MTLAEYTAERGSTKIVAIDADITYTTIYQIAKHFRFADLSTAFRIEMATKGVVRAESMVTPKSVPIIAYLRGLHA